MPNHSPPRFGRLRALRGKLRERYMYVALGILLALCLFVVNMAFVAYIRDIELSKAEQRGTLLAKVLEGHTSRTLGTVEASLNSIGRVLNDNAALEAFASSDEVQRVLDTSVVQATYLRSISILDSEGRVINSSRPANIGRVFGLAALGFSRELSTVLEPGNVLFARDLNEWQPKTTTTTLQAIPFAIRLPFNNTHLTLLALVNPDYLLLDYHETPQVERSYSALFDYQGNVLAADVGGPFQIGQRYQNLAMLETLHKDRDVGMFRLGGGINQEQQIVNFRAGRTLPFVAVVSVSEDAILRAWSDHTRNIKWAGYGAAMLVLFYSLVVFRSAQASQRAQQALRASEFRLRRLMNSSLVGIVQGDMAGNITDTNEVFLALTGYSRAELLGGKLKWADLTPIETHASDQKTLADLAQGGATQPVERTLIRQNSSPIPVLMGLTKLEGSAHEWVGFALDLTEQRRLDRLKAEFISMVSHELRTPVTSIRGSLGLLENGLAGALPEPAMKLIKIAHKNSQRLVGLVNDMLDIDRLLSGQMKMNLQPVDLVAVVEQAIEANAAYGQQHQVVFRFSSEHHSAVVNADFDRMMQVMANLLSNAAKFSAGAPQVEVRILRQDSEFRLEVEDYGRGIPLEFQGRIFSAFAQADDGNTRQQGGTGLGLHISRTMILQMGGKIGFSSEAGKGTIFWISLPVALER
jgi:PAS domain S-box-containing protein